MTLRTVLLTVACSFVMAAQNPQPVPPKPKPAATIESTVQQLALQMEQMGRQIDGLAARLDDRLRRDMEQAAMRSAAGNQLQQSANDAAAMRVRELEMQMLRLQDQLQRSQQEIMVKDSQIQDLRQQMLRLPRQ